MHNERSFSILSLTIAVLAMAVSGYLMWTTNEMGRAGLLSSPPSDYGMRSADHGALADK